MSRLITSGPTCLSDPPSQPPLEHRRTPVTGHQRIQRQRQNGTTMKHTFTLFTALLLCRWPFWLLPKVHKQSSQRFRSPRGATQAVGDAAGGTERADGLFTVLCLPGRDAETPRPSIEPAREGGFRIHGSSRRLNRRNHPRTKSCLDWRRAGLPHGHLPRVDSALDRPRRGQTVGGQRLHSMGTLRVSVAGRRWQDDLVGRAADHHDCDVPAGLHGLSNQRAGRRVERDHSNCAGDGNARVDLSRGV